jgi:hypothetical protein
VDRLPFGPCARPVARRRTGRGRPTGDSLGHVLGWGRTHHATQAGIVAAILAAGTTLIFVGPASAQQSDGPNCSDFPTQIDIANSIFPPDLDPTDLDANDDGVGCEANPSPPVPYDLTVFPPVALEPEPEPEPEPQPQPEPQPAATPAQPVTAEPDFTG